MVRWPQVADTWKDLGTIQACLHEAEAALVSLDRALAIEPSFTAARLGRALALQESFCIPEAVAEYEAVLRAEPAHPRGGTMGRLNPGGRTARWLGRLAKSWADGAGLSRYLHETRGRRNPRPASADDEALQRKMDAVVRTAQRGNLPRAAQMLVSPGIAPGSDQTAAKIRDILERPNPTWLARP